MTPAITAVDAGTAAGYSAAPPDPPAGMVKRVPRPPSAWILYRSDCIQKMRAEMPEGARKPTQADLSKQFGEQWRNESKEVKTSYERLAEAAKEEHAQKHPGESCSLVPKVLPCSLKRSLRCLYSKLGSSAGSKPNRLMAKQPVRAKRPRQRPSPRPSGLV